MVKEKKKENKRENLPPRKPQIEILQNFTWLRNIINKVAKYILINRSFGFPFPCIIRILKTEIVHAPEKEIERSCFRHLAKKYN